MRVVTSSGEVPGPPASGVSDKTMAQIFSGSQGIDAHPMRSDGFTMGMGFVSGGSKGV